jgi:hypothetical protein
LISSKDLLINQHSLHPLSIFSIQSSRAFQEESLVFEGVGLDGEGLAEGGDRFGIVAQCRMTETETVPSAEVAGEEGGDLLAIGDRPQIVLIHVIENSAAIPGFSKIWEVSNQVSKDGFGGAKIANGQESLAIFDLGESGAAFLPKPNAPKLRTCTFSDGFVGVFQI